jgi:hypothetical protein
MKKVAQALQVSASTAAAISQVRKPFPQTSSARLQNRCKDFGKSLQMSFENQGFQES